MAVPAKVDPSLFGAMQTVGQNLPATGFDAVDTEKDSIPFVAFLHSMSKKYGDVRTQLPTLADGQPYFGAKDKYTKLDPFTFFLLAANQAWVKKAGDNSGKVIAAIDKKPAFGSPYQEDINALIVVLLPDGSVSPALCSFRGARAKAAVAAIEAARLAATPEWVSKSTEHKASASIPDPRFRFTTTVTSWVKTGASGRAYGEAKGVITPLTNMAQIQAITSAFKNEEFVESLNACTGIYKSRVEETAKIIAETAKRAAA